MASQPFPFLRVIASGQRQTPGYPRIDQLRLILYVPGERCRYAISGSACDSNNIVLIPRAYYYVKDGSFHHLSAFWTSGLTKWRPAFLAWGFQGTPLPSVEQLLPPEGETPEDHLFRGGRISA
jgi:hypothetical protein